MPLNLPESILPDQAIFVPARACLNKLPLSDLILLVPRSQLSIHQFCPSATNLGHKVDPANSVLKSAQKNKHSSIKMATNHSTPAECFEYNRVVYNNMRSASTGTTTVATDQSLQTARSENSIYYGVDSSGTMHANERCVHFDDSGLASKTSAEALRIQSAGTSETHNSSPSNTTEDLVPRYRIPGPSNLSQHFLSKIHYSSKRRHSTASERKAEGSTGKVMFRYFF